MIRTRRTILFWALPAALLVLVAAVALLPMLAAGPVRPDSPVTHSRPADVRRERDIRFTNEYLYDSSYETCDALGAHSLARKLGVPVDRASLVARAFARQNYGAALRSGPYEGCLDALMSHLEEGGRRRAGMRVGDRPHP